jgi:hypothetical protein
VESKDPGSEDATKNFIFKPMDGETNPDVLVQKKGAGAAKESIASTKAKLFELQTGIDLGVPETSVATIGGYAIEKGGNAPKIGSIQQFEKADGDLTQLGVGGLDRIDREECQRMALNDIMALNVDRHQGNFLVQKGGGPKGSPRLVPIDHGCTMPTPDDLTYVSMMNGDGAADHIGGLLPNRVDSQNILLHMPGAYEKFSQDIQDRLALMEPDVIAAGTKEHLAALDKVNPGLKAAQNVPQGSIDLSTRVLKFLKRAAPTLSPAEIQIAIAQHKDIFANLNQNIEDVADQIIQAAAPKGPGYAEFFGLTGDQRQKMVSTLVTNGWTNAGGAGAFIMKDPVTALKLYKGDVKKREAGDPVAAANAINMLGARANYARDLLADTADLLPAADPAAAAALARRYAQLDEQVNHTVASDERQAKLLEDQAKTLYKDVSYSVLAALATAGKKLYEDNVKRFAEGDKRDEFTKTYNLDFVTAASARPNVAAARSGLELLRQQVAALGEA